MRSIPVYRPEQVKCSHAGPSSWTVLGPTLVFDRSPSGLPDARLRASGRSRLGHSSRQRLPGSGPRFRPAQQARRRPMGCWLICRRRTVGQPAEEELWQCRGAAAEMYRAEPSKPTVVKSWMSQGFDTACALILDVVLNALRSAPGRPAEPERRLPGSVALAVACACFPIENDRAGFPRCVAVTHLQLLNLSAHPTRCGEPRARRRRAPPGSGVTSASAARARMERIIGGAARRLFCGPSVRPPQ